MGIDDSKEKIMCLKSDTQDKGMWNLDNRCLRHMIGRKEDFKHLKPKKEGEVTFGDNLKGKIQGIETFGQDSASHIDNVLFVKRLKYNLLSVNQLCDKKFRVTFECLYYYVIDTRTNKIPFIGKRKWNVYVIYLDYFSSNNICFMEKRS